MVYGEPKVVFMRERSGGGVRGIRNVQDGTCQQRVWERNVSIKYC